MAEKYFASLPTNEVGNELRDKVEKYYNFMYNSGIFRRQYRSIMHYYGVSPTTGAQTDMIRPGGKASQLSMVKINHFRNLAQNIIQLATSQRPSPQPVATNTDAKSQQQVSVAKGAVEYYNRLLRIDQLAREACEMAVVGGDGFMVTTWEDDDICVKMLPSTEVIRDPTKSTYKQNDWVITRDWMDRFTAADKYAGPKNEVDGVEPSEIDADLDQVRERILSQPTKLTYVRARMSMLNWLFASELLEKSDDIAVYTLWHKRNSSVPNGRMIIFLEDGTVLYDGDLPFKHITVRRITPGELVGSSFGYTPMFDLLVIQEAIDALYSAVATNQMTFGVQLIMAMKGSDIDFKQLSKGLAFIEYANPDGKPEPLNLTHTPEEVFAFIGQLEKTMETISGVNSVVRGNPQESLKSGAALALVQSQAIQYMSGLQQSYVALLQDVYTDIVNILKQNVKSPKTISIVGKFNRSQLISFQGESISEIDRVTFDVAGALEQTVSGRLTIGENLINSGLIKSPEEYLAVLKTGTLEPMLEGPNAELILIKSENENVADGKEIVALITDDHSLHIREHRCVLATPEARTNPKIVQAMEEHITQHVMFLSDPTLQPLFAVLGYNTLAGAMMPEVGQGYSQNAGKGQPSMPKNPATGKEWNPEDGGLGNAASPTGTKGGGGTGEE